MSDYQVVIIGGRPAGASLAIRLGRLNIRTLLVDKMTFPSLPAVPSSPIIYSQHMQVLEELGITENELFHADGRIDAFVVNFVGHFHEAIPMSVAEAKHSYAYGADRTKFDTAIWEHAGKYDSVTTRSGFSVTGVLKENGRVVGIKGQSERGKEETIHADLVVGADGRFSFAAQQFEAATLEEHNQHITNSYHAEWENIGDGFVPHSGTMYNTGKGWLVLMIPIDTRKYIVGTYARPGANKNEKRVEEGYLEALQSIPAVWARLKDAQRTTPVVGVKGIRNGIRQPVGDGWALVGDAFHYKDPLDGQGIYDALLEAKSLAEAIQSWLSGAKTWAQAGETYKEQAINATRPMMLQTVKRVKNEMFTDPPAFIIKTLVRWMLSSREYQRDFMRLLTRVSDPAHWQTPGVMRRAIWNGLMNDLFRRKTAPASIPVEQKA
ncbi:MAG: NAD(P)/FAD-dependent oxidoreductase [Chloroflexi bacterium]|nr:NAD(P)/FAD-dependent oxidoreductase [Chloroflexota bacterium]